MSSVLPAPRWRCDDRADRRRFRGAPDDAKQGVAAGRHRRGHQARQEYRGKVRNFGEHSRGFSMRAVRAGNEVLRRAAAYLSQANLPGKINPARDRARRRQEPRRGDVPDPQARSLAVLPLAGLACRRCQTRRRLPGQTPYSTPTATIWSSRIGTWWTRPAMPANRWQSARRSGSARRIVCGACLARSESRSARQSTMISSSVISAKSIVAQRYHSTSHL